MIQFEFRSPASSLTERLSHFSTATGLEAEGTAKDREEALGKPSATLNKGSFGDKIPNHIHNRARL